MDTFSSDTSNNYYIGGGSISVGNGVLTYTGSSTDVNNYINIKSALTPAISNFQGRDTYFKAEISNLPTGVTAQIRIYQTVNGSTDSTYTEYSTDGTASHNRIINANATSVVFRIMFVGLGENTVTIDNFRVY